MKDEAKQDGQGNSLPTKVKAKAGVKEEKTEQKLPAIRR